MRQQSVTGEVRRAQRGRDVPVVSWVLRWGQLQCVCVKGCLSPLVVTTIIVLRETIIMEAQGKGQTSVTATRFRDSLGLATAGLKWRVFLTLTFSFYLLRSGAVEYANRFPVR